MPRSSINITANATKHSMCLSCRARPTCSFLRKLKPVTRGVHIDGQAAPSDSPSAFAPERSHHQRQLPEGLIPFSSKQGRRFFAESLQEGQSEAYFPLAEQFVTQSETAYCGLACLTMCMNALRIDPLRIWKDAPAPGWRWWTDDMFPTSCSGSLERLREDGVDMDQFNRLALANGADVTMQRTTDPGESLNAFRQALIEAAEMKKESFLVVSFCRARLGQTGTGHFSPIAGYHAGSDSALVLDVARFKYPPYWVPVRDLWHACNTIDESTGRSRGWFTLSAPSVRTEE